jgi:hypothetical protein
VTYPSKRSFYKTNRIKTYCIIIIIIVGLIAPIRRPSGLQYPFQTIPKLFQDQLNVFSFFSDNLPFTFTHAVEMNEFFVVAILHL